MLSCRAQHANGLQAVRLLTTFSSSQPEPPKAVPAPAPKPPTPPPPPPTPAVTNPDITTAGGTGAPGSIGSLTCATLGPWDVGAEPSCEKALPLFFENTQGFAADSDRQRKAVMDTLCMTDCGPVYTSALLAARLGCQQNGGGTRNGPAVVGSAQKEMADKAPQQAGPTYPQDYPVRGWLVGQTEGRTCCLFVFDQACSLLRHFISHPTQPSHTPPGPPDGLHQGQDQQLLLRHEARGHRRARRQICRLRLLLLLVRLT